MIISRKFIRLLLNSVLGVILILIWIRFVNLEQIITRLKSTDLKVVSLFFVFFISSTFIRAIRLKLLISSSAKLRELIALNWLAQFLSFAIPIRAGEIARSIYLSNISQEPISKTLVWVFLDRFLDFWVLIVLGVILGTTIQSNLPQQSFSLLLILTLGFSLAATIIIVSNDFAKKMAISLRLKFAIPIIEGFSLFHRRIPGFLSLIGLTFLAVISDTLSWFFVLLSLKVDLGFWRTLLGASLNILTFVIPSAPGYVGSAEAAGLAVWSGVIGLDSNTASSLVVLYHLLNIIALPLFGIASLYFLKFNLDQIWKILKRK